jgi:hypothetical protein
VTGIPGQNGGIDHLEAIVFDFDGLILDTVLSLSLASARSRCGGSLALAAPLSVSTPSPS